MSENVFIFRLWFCFFLPFGFNQHDINTSFLQVLRLTRIFITWYMNDIYVWPIPKAITPHLCWVLVTPHVVISLHRSERFAKPSYYIFFSSSHITGIWKNLVLVWLLGCCSMFSICLKTILNMLVTGYTKKILLYHFAIWFKLGSNLILVEYWSNLSIRLMQNIPHLARHDHEWVSVNNDIDRDYSRVHHIIHTTSLHLLESIWMRILHFAESIFTPEVYRKSVHVAQISYHIVHKTEAQG